MSRVLRIVPIALGLQLLALVGCSSTEASSRGTGSGGGTAGGGSGGKSGSAGAATGGATSGAGGTTSGGTGGTGGTAGTSAGGSSAGGTGGSSSGGTNNGLGGAASAVTVDCNATPGTAPASTWVNATANLANMTSECGNSTMVTAQPCSPRVIVGIAKQGLWASDDGGMTWGKLGTGAGSAVITNRPQAFAYDPLDPAIFYESGIYNGGGVYKTTDSGTTFTQLGTVTHNDSVSVDFADAARLTLLAGPHETAQKVYRSTDAGMNWNDIGATLPGGSGFSTATLVMDASTYLVGCNNSGIFRTTNGGGMWSNVGTGGVIPQPLVAANGDIYWYRNGGGVMRSSDSGQSFSQVADANLSPGLVSTAPPAELPDGRIVVIGKDHLQATANGGTNWAPIGDAFPFMGGGFEGVAAVAYVAQLKMFFISKWDCTDKVADDAVWSAGFDWETQ